MKKTKLFKFNAPLVLLGAIFLIFGFTKSKPQKAVVAHFTKSANSKHQIFITFTFNDESGNTVVVRSNLAGAGGSGTIAVLESYTVNDPPVGKPDPWVIEGGTVASGSTYSGVSGGSGTCSVTVFYTPNSTSFSEMEYAGSASFSEN
jgi:hypothetical protein